MTEPETSTAPDNKGKLKVKRPKTAVAAVVLALAAAVVAVWYFWPNIMWGLGLVQETTPHHTGSQESTSTADPNDELGGEVSAEEEKVGSKIGSKNAPPTDDYLVIPRIGVDIGIYGGADGEKGITYGVYHHLSTAAPGGGREIVLAGHRVSRALALLYKLEKGDDIYVDWGGTDFHYVVTKKYAVAPTDERILANSTTETLRVYTCLPRYKGNKRVVIEATPAK